MSSSCQDSKTAPSTTARIFFQWLDYRRTLEEAGIMPCLHVAVVRTASSNSGGGTSSRAGNSCISYEHHAIFDRERDEYIHVITDDAGGSHVVQTARRAFELESSTRPRVVKRPLSIQEAHDIVARARARARAASGTWEYHLLSHNCEHFVNECWNPTEPPSSSQAATAAAQIGGSTAAGALSGGAGSAVAMAAITTTATQPWYFLGVIQWGTVTTSTTVMAGLPAAAVIGITAGTAVVGAGLFGGIAYGVRELVQNHQSKNDELVPIAIYNLSGHAITASLQNEDSAMSHALYKWRALIGVGLMSVDIENGMTEELNPPTVWDSGDTEFVLSVTGEPFQQKTCKVQRGDVVTFNGIELIIAPRPEPLTCQICFERPQNVILLPCRHHEFCEDCILEIMERDSRCPCCRNEFQEHMV